MRTYRPGQVPTNPAELPGFLIRELARIHKAANESDPYGVLDELHVAPTKVFNGMVVLADGADWDPGSGGGFYGYYGGVWVKLG